MSEVSAKAAGYSKDYDVCASANAQTADYCAGGKYLLGRDFATGRPAKKDPAMAFQNTLKAAGQGYVPAAAAVGMMYAVGKGVPQSFAEAEKWWTKAAEAGHVLAATNLSMVYRGAPGVPGDTAKHEKWTKFVAEHAPANAQ